MEIFFARLLRSLRCFAGLFLPWALAVLLARLLRRYALLTRGAALTAHQGVVEFEFLLDSGT